MFELALLLVFVAIFLLSKKFYRQAQDQKLRDNPPPRRIIEVSLPRDVNDSAISMQRFLRKISSQITTSSSAERKLGQRQLDIVYMATRTAPGQDPILRFLIYADSDKMDAVKRALKQSYDSVAEVIEIDHDPLMELRDKVRVKKDQDLPDIDESEIRDLKAGEEE